MSQHHPRASPTKIKPIPAFFSPGEKRDVKALKAREAGKMAAAGKDIPEGADLPSKADIQGIAGRLESLEKGLLSKITDLIQPLTEKIDHLTVSLQKVASVAEGAMNLSTTQQEEIKAIQITEEQHAEQLAILGNRQRFYNLKFRALEEKIEGDMDLAMYLSTWLASVLNLSGEAPIYITQAFRVGKAYNPTRTLPRDIVATFADIQVKNKILNLAREKGFLTHKQDRVYVYLDLTTETLQKKKELKEITSALTEVNMRYRWITPLKLQILHRGKAYYIRSEDEGYEVLKQLNVPVPMRTDKSSFKRKSNVLNSPEKTTKKHSTDT